MKIQKNCPRSRLWTVALVAKIICLNGCQNYDSPNPSSEKTSETAHDQPFVLGPVPVVPSTNSIRQNSPNVDTTFDLLKSQVTQIFTVFCISCHNSDKQEGRFTNLLDLRALAANKQLIAAENAEMSVLYQKTYAHGTMKTEQIPSLGHRETVKRWIQSLVGEGHQ